MQDLEIIRHTCSHVMAEAVKELFPEVKVAIGPAIENGFYYDFDRDTPFTPEDLPKIEQRMLEIIKRGEPIVREEWTRAEVEAFFKKAGEPYKLELLQAIPEGEKISVYKQGAFWDLCRGPHLESTGKLPKAFKLTKLAGAYWRGDSKNKQLQRIYGVAFDTKDALAGYFKMIEEAEKRDHRRLGKEMDLFHFEDVAPGDVFWHPKGWKLYLSLVDYVRRRQENAGYIEISTPQIMDKVLWETSGHWNWFRENMFTTEIEERTFAVKPMSCPGGLLVYKHDIVSYRDLPMRVAEFGRVHRYESSGSLHGLMRVRAFTQDDAHIFCTSEQLEAECRSVIELMLDIYGRFGLSDVSIKLSTRPEGRMGDDALWDRLENALADVLTKMEREYILNPGDGAFYGPKLDFKVKDALGREWQLGTLQADLNLPERFDIHYIAEDGSKQRPIMLHRALFGSLERFLGTYLEITAGRLPLWISPVQAVVASITNDADGYALDVVAALKKAGIRAAADVRSEKIGYKIREHSAAKVPVIFAVGKKEEAEKTVTERRLGSQEQKTLALDAALAKLTEESKMPGL